MESDREGTQKLIIAAIIMQKVAFLGFLFLFFINKDLSDTYPRGTFWKLPARAPCFARRICLWCWCKRNDARLCSHTQYADSSTKPTKRCDALMVVNLCVRKSRIFFLSTFCDKIIWSGCAYNYVQSIFSFFNDTLQNIMNSNFTTLIKIIIEIKINFLIKVI